MITNTQEDYLRALYLLEEELKRPIKSVELMEKLGLTKSTISGRLNDLQKAGWIIQGAYQPIKLTHQGRKIAKDLTFKHRVIETFLIKSLQMDASEVHEEAHKLEHALSDKVVKKLYDFLGKPEKCPHGSEIQKN